MVEKYSHQVLCRCIDTMTTLSKREKKDDLMKTITELARGV